MALEVVIEWSTLAELSGKYELHANQTSSWKKEFLANHAKVFGRDHLNRRDIEKERDRLFRKA